METKSLPRQFLSTVLSVTLCIAGFEFLQAILIPKFMTDGTAITTAYRYLEDDSLDMLAIGSSQMFCTVDAGMLTRDYGISSFDYGASMQEFASTKYYFDTAMKTQSPKLVMFEVCNLFVENTPIGKPSLAWNYSAPPASLAKFESLYEVTGRDVMLSLEYTVAPIIDFHDRWKAITKNDITYALNPRGFCSETLERRGFLPREHVEEGLELAYKGDVGEMKEIPARNVDTVKYIADACRDQGIEIIFFKSPACDWTRGDSSAAKALFAGMGLTYLDMNDHIESIGIDPATDFYNNRHLNTAGAQKSTRWLASYLQQRGFGI